MRENITKLSKIQKILAGRDLDHMGMDETRNIARALGVRPQDVLIANNISTYQRSLKEQEVLDGGDGCEAEAVSPQRILKMLGL